MQSSPKRRKVSHNGDVPHFGTSAAMATASPFVLQTEELLKEVRVDYARAFPGVDTLLGELKDAIDKIPSTDPVPIAEATRKFQKKHQIRIPFPVPEPAADAPYKLAFAKPAAYNVVGSYVSKTMVESQPNKVVDMIVQMPQSLFQEKDFQNMRYFYRRAYFIAHIAAGIRNKLAASVDLKFEDLHDNPLLPVLSVQPAEADSNDEEESQSDAEDRKDPPGYVIRIIPCSLAGLFAKSKLSPSSNCHKMGDTDAPTPFYNSTIKAEETYVTYLRVLARAKTQCAAFSDACVLGRIWLAQRGFAGSMSRRGFGHFEWAVMTALLLQKGSSKNAQAALSSSLSSTELFKATIQFLASTDLVAKPFVFGTQPPRLDSVREAGPVMYDAERELNILYKMTSWSANLLRQYAATTLQLLSSDSSDHFEATFISRAAQQLQITDTLLEIEGIDIDRYSSTPDRQGAPWNFSSKVYTTLKTALGDRATLIDILIPERPAWSLSQPRPLDATGIEVGIAPDAANMSKPMEYGPSAEAQKEAAKFRQFWGERAELRRFKDGSILECVPWASTNATGICEEIVRYILKLHVGVTTQDIHFKAMGLPASIDFTPVDKTAFDAARQAFQTLEHDIRGLEGMPLSVRRLAPVAPELRYASVKPPAVGFHKGSVPPLDVQLSFEASSRWPENLFAIQEAKIEFLLDIATRLGDANDSITTSLGRDDASAESDNLAFLDVIYDTGAAFRLRIHADLEDTLLERRVKNKTLDPHIRAAAEDALSKINWRNTQLPLHTQSIASLCTRLVSLSPTIRLVKHWFSTHKLSNSINEELVELFVLHVFLQPEPWKIPSSAQQGLLRTLLFLSRWDWRTEPLVVDMADEMTPEDRTGVRHSLDSWRVRDPNMTRAALFVATSHEPSGLAYTRLPSGASPSKLAATRMTRLAKSACKMIRDSTDHSVDIPSLFRPTLRDYDLLIHLSTPHIKRIFRETEAVASGSRNYSAFKNLDSRTGKNPAPLARHPADVLTEELESAYEDSLFFFRGARGDAVLGAIWQPKLRRQAFRVGLPYNFHRVPDEDGGDSEGDDAGAVEVNKDAILLEIARIGGDLISKIEVAE